MSDDPIFLQKLRAKNKESFEALVKKFQKTVLNICYRFLLNKQDAEDITQEVFIEIYHALPSFRGDAKLSTWIFRIAVTKSLDELKKRKRKKRITSAGKLLGLDILIEKATQHQNPQEIMESNETLNVLLNALDTLPESQRVALTLSKTEGYSNIEIAAIMETTTTAVDSLIYRAKQNLKIYLKQ